MCPKPPLETYAEQICTSAKIISAYCAENSYPQPSFDPQAPSITLPSSAPQNVLSARQKMITAALKVQQLAVEPSEYLPHLAIHFQNFACIHWLCHFRIISFVPLQGSVPYSEVAIIAGVAESHLRSVARMAMISNFMCEPVPGELGHSATSALLVTNPSLLDYAIYMAEYSALGAANLVAATEKWGASEERNQTAFNIAKNTDLPYFDYLAQSPEMRRAFSAYMKNVTASEGTKIEHLVNGYDWAGLGEATVVDIGGGNCHASIALATAFPKLQFIVQDLPETISNAQNLLSQQPESVRARIKPQAHNFFNPQPVKGADVYLLRMILHDWPEAEAIKILRNLLYAMKANSGVRLVVMDTVLPTPGSIPPIDEALLRVRDLSMIEAFNSKEREVDEWLVLFAQAAAEDEGKLVLKSSKKPFGSVMSVMEWAYTTTDVL